MFGKLDASFDKGHKKLVFIIFLFFSILFILTLELFSRKECADFYRNLKSPCMSLEKKYFPDFWYRLAEENLKLTDDNLKRIVSDYTLAVPESEISGANGISCYHHNYIANNLPFRAKRYVAIHEAIHLLADYSETKTNYIAASKEPIGFLETIIFSIAQNFNQISRTTNINNIGCRLGGLWNIFKVYFLNIDF